MNRRPCEELEYFGLGTSQIIAGVVVSLTVSLSDILCPN